LYIQGFEVRLDFWPLARYVLVNKASSKIDELPKLLVAELNRRNDRFPRPLDRCNRRLDNVLVDEARGKIDELPEFLIAELHRCNDRFPRPLDRSNCRLYDVPVVYIE